MFGWGHNKGITDNAELQADVQTIERNKADIVKKFESEIRAQISTCRNYQEILQCVMLSAGEYQSTYEIYDIGSHNNKNGSSNVDYDLTLSALLDKLMLQAAVNVGLDREKFAHEINEYLHNGPGVK